MFSSLRAEEVEEEAQLLEARKEPAHSQDDSQHCLWVDEFAPQHYTELLSDDVRPCSGSSVTGFLVAKEGEFWTHQTIYQQLTGLFGWRAGLGSDLPLTEL